MNGKTIEAFLMKEREKNTLELKNERLRRGWGGGGLIMGNLWYGCK